MFFENKFESQKESQSQSKFGGQRSSIVGSDAMTALDNYRGIGETSPPLKKQKRPTTAINRSSLNHHGSVASVVSNTRSRQKNRGTIGF